MNKILALSIMTFALTACGSGGGDPAPKGDISSIPTPDQNSGSSSSAGLTDEAYMAQILSNATEAVEASTFLIKDNYESTTTHRETFIAAQGMTDAVEVVDEFVGYFTDEIEVYQEIYVKRIVEWYEDGMTGADSSTLNFDGEYYLTQMSMQLDVAETDLIDFYNASIITRFNSVEAQLEALEAANIPEFIAESFDTIWVEVNESITLQ